MTTVLVRQMGSDNSWWVLGSSTPNIVMQAPAAGATIASPTSLRGTSTAFEATVNYALNQDDHAAPLKEGIVMGGANGDMGPYSATVTFPTPASARGSLVMYTISAESGNVAEASVVRVAFR
ncbi:MAG TPA: Gmad2 immunoglobulin-like domain-containing protein [Acidimicrobiia bacterium]|nr:Gmad2 immunoglobulin-like domain-containing protein [Acidimicrobiia bacterium]